MVAEIISTVERRRNWPTDAKLRILSEALEPGATVAAVADRNGVCRSQLYAWLRLARDNKLPGISARQQPAPSFASVRIAAPGKVLPSLPMSLLPAGSDDHVQHLRAPSRGRRPALVEVTLTNGRVIKVDECIDPASLALLVAALDGGAR